MRLKVTVYWVGDGEKMATGTLLWDGNKFITDGNEYVEEILKSPILVPLDSGGRDYIWPNDDPEQFMRKLNFNYQGSYFKCGPAKEY